MNRSVISLSAAILSVTGFSAQAQPGLTLYDFNRDSIEQVLKEYGFDHDHVDNGDLPTVNLTTEDGWNYLLISTACQAAGDCAGLAMVATFNGTEISDSVLETFNYGTYFASAVRIGTSVHVRRYLISDDGIPALAVKTNITIFESVVDKFADDAFGA